MCQAFSLVLLACKKTHPKDGQWKIFVVASDVNTSREKYFEFRKSLTHFDVICQKRGLRALSRVPNTSKQMKALGLRPRAFICFEVFGTRDKARSPSF